MNFSITSKSPETIGSYIVIGVFENQSLTRAAKTINTASRGTLLQNLKARRFSGKVGESLELTNLPGTKSKTILVIGLGSNECKVEFIRTIQNMFVKIRSTGEREITLYLPELKARGVSRAWMIRQTASIGTSVDYKYQLRKTVLDGTLPAGSPAQVSISVEGSHSADRMYLAQGSAIGRGMNLAKDLGNLPANVCTPTFLAETTIKLGKLNKFSVKCLSETDMKKLGMGALLSVSQGSKEPAKLIHAAYSGGKKKDAPIVLVGKGITFDTGGISLKPSSEMDEMKYDMCGAASVIGTLLAVSEMKLPINVVGLIAAAENMPSGTATRPGDVVTTMSGKTIEILNTDAEGRLVLCDALTYAEKLRPAAAIDVATLTGACIISLGKVASGLFSNNDELANEISQAGTTSWDRVWRMPIWDDYTKLLSSNFADLANIGGREAGSITAACFLAQFATSYPWAHLDIAGTAWVSGKEKGATGRPVPLLCEFLLNRASSQ
ncbi:MAG: leucyl aminopeptidase [Proteobacteria bacterium]|nr:leucyl aminopeptidase [Pseudomonadota bacterium]MDA1332066.1 leucyl aminopeptidase [Pseudomonadota bacterium]